MLDRLEDISMATLINERLTIQLQAVEMDINSVKRCAGGVDGTRTRDPRRDRPVF